MQEENYQVSMYQTPFLFPTVAARWHAKLLIVSEIILSYQYLYNLCLQLMLKWWQKNNGEVFKEEFKRHMHITHYFWEVMCTLQDLHIIAKKLARFCSVCTFTNVHKLLWRLNKGFYER